MTKPLLIILRISVTAQSGIHSKKLQLSIATIISGGNVDCISPPIPTLSIIVCISPCVILNTANINSNPYVTTVFVNINLINNFSTCSGFFTSANEEQVFIIPNKKNNTSKANPIACIAPFIFTTIFHIEPPLKFSGVCVISVHISFSFSFHTLNAYCKFPTTQLSDNFYRLPKINLEQVI